MLKIKIIFFLLIMLIININETNAKLLRNKNQLINYISGYIKENINLNKDENIKIHVKNIEKLNYPINTVNIFNPTNLAVNGGTCTFIYKCKQNFIPLYTNYKILKKVIIAKTNIKVNEIIDYNNIIIKKVEKFKIVNNYIKPEDIKNIIGSYPRFNLKEGSIITYSMIKKPYQVKANSIVNVIIKKNNLIIQTTARALRNAYKGEYIKIITKFNKIIEGKVIDINTVQVIL